MENGIDKSTLEFYAAQAKNYSERAVKTDVQAVTQKEPDTENILNGNGRLKVQVTYAYGSLPVSNASVSVKSNRNGVSTEHYNGVTDNSGIAQDILLPAPVPTHTQDYATKDDFDTTYYVSVFHPGFVPADDLPVQIYNGIETILPVDLIKREV